MKSIPLECRKRKTQNAIFELIVLAPLDIFISDPLLASPYWRVDGQELVHVMQLAAAAGMHCITGFFRRSFRLHLAVYERTLLRKDMMAAQSKPDPQI